MARPTITEMMTVQAETALSLLQERVYAAIEEHRDQLVQLAHAIHAHPELAFGEEYAAARLSAFLADQGFIVRTGVGGLPTAFVATVGAGPLHIGFCAEYDALPPTCLGAISRGGVSADQDAVPALTEVWLGPERQDTPLRHGCGHNVIAGVAVTAALGLRDIAKAGGLTVSVFGTPGEELLGLPEPPEGHLTSGKVALLEAGAFEGVHALLMAHPGPTPWSMFYPTHVYLRQRARFSAAGRPSLDVAELRRLEEALRRTVLGLQQIPLLFAARPAGPEAGAQADLVWVAESADDGRRGGAAVRRCFVEAGAAAGVAVEVSPYATNTEMRNDPLLSAAFRENSRAVRRVREQDAHIQEEIRAIFSVPSLPWATRLIAPLARRFPHIVAPPGLFMDKCPVEIMFGTDLAPVSEVIPAIQPFIGIGGLMGVHTAEFADQADTEEAYRAMLDGGIALAWTALDAVTDPALKAHLLGGSQNGESHDS